MSQSAIGVLGNLPATKRLGEILIDDGFITPPQLEEALRLQQEKGGFLGQILVDLKYVSQERVVSCLVRQCKIPHLSLLDYEISKEVLALLPREICLKHKLLPIDKLGRILTIAMANPLDTEALEEIRQVCPDLRIKPILCDWQHFQIVASRLFNIPQEQKSSEFASFGPGVKGSAGSEKQKTEPQSAAPQPAAPLSAAPLPAPKVRPELEYAVANIIHAAQQTADQTTDPADEPAGIVQAQPISAQQLTSLMRQTLASAMQEAMATLSVQNRQQHVAAPEDLAAVLRQSMREALRENEAGEVARANREDLEAGGPDRQRQTRHASVTSFRARTREMIESPEWYAECDEQVLEAMNAERLLKGFAFDNFFAGKANAFTYKLCQGVAGRPGAEFNPFFLYGDVGLGKTHLINAIGNAVTAADPKKRVGYVSSSRFATRLADALQEDAGELFRENYCHWEVLILDDIQFLGGRVEAQEEFFHIFNVLQQEGRQIIIAGDKAPDRLGLLEQRLVSRFSGGIVASVKPPEWETRVAILQRHAEAARKTVPQEVLSLVALRVTNDNRKMIGALRKVLAFAEMGREPLTCDLVNDILSHLGIIAAA